MRPSAVEVSGQVVDTEELAKLTKGVYTGLSFGGSYAWRKQDGIHVRYAAKPVELSLADKPCVPTARFTLVKADGSEVEMGFDVGRARRRQSRGPLRHRLQGRRRQIRGREVRR